MFKVKMTQPAKNDIKEAAVWYNRQQKGLGKRFIQFVRKKVHFIVENLFAYAVKYGNVRTATLDVFPYTIHFVVENNIVVVLAVFHTSRKPISG